MKKLQDGDSAHGPKMILPATCPKCRGILKHTLSIAISKPAKQALRLSLVCARECPGCGEQFQAATPIPDLLHSGFNMEIIEKARQ